MKKIFAGLVMGLMGLLLMAPIASAYPVSAGDTIVATFGVGGGVNGGGAFNVDKFGDGLGVLFDTFCLERNEYFTPGEQMFIGSITDYAKAGGLSGGPDDPLDSRSAYLMYQWASWSIEHTALNANALQLAIWKIEGEWPDSLIGLAQTYYNDADTNKDGTLYGVQVMNLYGLPVTGAAPTVYKQDMLVYTPVPEPITILLLGLGLVGLAGLKRKI